MSDMLTKNEILYPFGPFDLVTSNHRLGGREVDVAESKVSLKRQIQLLGAKAGSGRPDCGDLGDKNGLYVFAIRTPGRNGPIKPFYVGRTVRQGLLDEAFGPHQKDRYREALGKSKGTPVMCFIAPPGKKKKLDKRLLEDWERILIYLAYSRNYEICNTHHVPRAMRIEGVRVLRHQNGTHTRGQSKTISASDLNRMFGL